MKRLLIIFIIWTISLFGLDGDHPYKRVNTYGDTGAAHTGSYGNDPTDYGWGWAYRQCHCNKSDNPCCTSECRYRYCLSNNAIGTQGFPPKCLPFVKQFNDCRKNYDPLLQYSDDKDSTHEANGNNKGSVAVNMGKSPKPVNVLNEIKKYQIKVKQGTFIDSNINKVTFTLNDALGKVLRFRYKTYDCSDESIKDKEFDTLTLSEVTTVGSTGVEKQLVLKEIKIPFICQTPYFTITTVKKIISTIYAIGRYRGIGRNLIGYEEDRDVYYVYIDETNGAIMQYHIDEKSNRKIHRERYELNMKKCQYEVKEEDTEISGIGGRTILKSDDDGWGFEEDTKIYINIPNSKDKLFFTWGSLKESGYYSKKKKYKQKIPKAAQEILGKFKDAGIQFREISKSSSIMQVFKSLYDYPGIPKEVQCGGKVSMESMLIPPLDGLQDPDVEFSIDIQPSTKSEIKVMKAFLNNEVGNPGDFILKALQQAGGDDGK
jgi:hypothetical protein